MNTNTYFVFNCNVLALFTFYALPSGGKLKDTVVHCDFNDFLEFEKRILRRKWERQRQEETVWLDWQSFDTLEKSKKSLAICKGLFIIWQNFEPTLVMFYALGQIFNVVSGQILKILSSHLVTLKDKVTGRDRERE